MSYYIGVDPSFVCTGIIYFVDDQFFYSQKIVFVDRKVGCKFVSKIDKQSGLFVKAVGGDDTVLSDISSTCFLKGNVGRQILSYYYAVYASLEQFLLLYFNLSEDKDEIVNVGIEIPMGFHQGAGVKIDRAFTAFVIAVDSVFKSGMVASNGDYNLFMFTPPEIKKFVTGKGNAKKELVMKDVYKRWGFETDCLDLSDAYAIAQYTRKKVEDGTKNWVG